MVTKAVGKVLQIPTEQKRNPMATSILSMIGAFTRSTRVLDLMLLRLKVQSDQVRLQVRLGVLLD